MLEAMLYLEMIISFRNLKLTPDLVFDKKKIKLGFKTFQVVKIENWRMMFQTLSFPNFYL